jgi:hypothetical protein
MLKLYLISEIIHHFLISLFFGHTITGPYTDASPDNIKSDVLAMTKEESHDTSDVFHSGMLKGGD